MKKIDVYKLELKILILFVAAIILTFITMLLLSLLVHITQNILIVEFRVDLDTYNASFILGQMKQFKSVTYCIVFVLWFHLLFRKRVVCFLQINETIQDIAKGDFKTRISNDYKNEYGSLASLSSNINIIMDKFTLAIADERRAEQTKIDLITSVSHDLRTPLTSIIGYLQLVDNDEYQNEFILRSYINIALTKSKALKVLIDDLFELTTLDNYGIKISKNKINIIELIKQLAIEHRLNFKKANIECRLNVIDEKIYVMGDSNKLVRAFENLIFNCIKYSKFSRFMDITVTKIGFYAVLEFINYGEQIPPMELPYIFERFYRVDKARSQETGGSGLGLAITKNIIELHDGKIEVTSNASRTAFKVVIPLWLQ